MSNVMLRVLQKLRRHGWGLWPLKTLVIDLRFGGYVGGRRRTRFAHLGATDVHNIPYRIVNDAMSCVAIGEEDVLVDVGCGLGRVINWWLYMGLRNRLIGIELDPLIAAKAQSRLSSFPNVSITCGNAVECTPSDATVCFLFNPFGHDVMKAWADKMLESHANRPLTIIYVNCEHLKVFLRSPKWMVKMLPRDPQEYCKIAYITRTECHG